jgi:hypothetical protein
MQNSKERTGIRVYTDLYFTAVRIYKLWYFIRNSHIAQRTKCESLYIFPRLSSALQKQKNCWPEERKRNLKKNSW